MGQDNRLGGWNLVLNLRIVAQWLKLALRCQRFEVAHSIQQDSIRNLGMPFAARSEHYDLLVFEACRLGESEHAQVGEDAVQRLAEVPGLGVDSAQQIIAEVGVQAATFPSAGNLVSWVGACPGEDETAGVNRSKRSPKGNRQMRRILHQAANAAVKHKGSIFEIVYRRFVLRLGHNKTIGAIAHRLCQLIWIILHKGVRYEERGPAVSEKSKQMRTTRMIRTLRKLGYRVEPLPNPA
jgi:transposase